MKYCQRLTLGCAVLAMCYAGHASAQVTPTNEATSADEGDIVVTAQLREQRLATVPMSISALSGQQLDSSVGAGVEVALTKVPGVYANPGGARLGAASTIIIRGVVPSVGGATTAYYLDSIPFGVTGSTFFSSIAPDASAYDLERVEVLRGPQGTLYGLSASNGVVRVLTKDPSLDKFELKARTGVSATKSGGRNYRGDAAVNIPLIDGKLAVRGVLSYQDMGGWIDNLVRKDSNSSDAFSGRVKIAAKPTDELTLGGMAWVSRWRNDGPSIGRDNGTLASSFYTPSSENYEAYNFTASYQFPGFSIRSMSSYLDWRLRVKSDFSALGGGNTNVLLTLNNDAKIFSQEVIATSASDGPWQWTVGGIYRNGSVRSYTTRTNAITGALIAPTYLAPNIQKNYSKSFAVFGELTRSFFDGAVELTGGLRYFKDTIRAREISAQTVVGGIPAGGLFSVKNKYDSVTPRAVLAWHPGGNGTVYASYSEGFRSGLNQGFSTARLAPGYPAAEPDLLKNYEVGLKRSLFDGAVNLEAAAFYIDWRNVQQAFTVVINAATIFPVSVVQNAASASGEGFEVGLSVTPMTGLTLSGNVSWNDLTVDASLFNQNDGSLVLAKGQRLGGSPKYLMNGSINYEFPVSDNLDAGFFASTSYTPRVFLSRSATNAAVLNYSDRVFTGDLGFFLEAQAGWKVTLYVDNVGNADPMLTRDTFTREWDARLRPRTIGLQLEFRY